MGVLKARVSGAWVPIAPAQIPIPPPAYLGPRRDVPTSAQFSHQSVGGATGFIVSDTGTLDLVGAEGGSISFWRASGPVTAPTGYVFVARFDTAGRLLVGKAASSGTVEGAELSPSGALITVVGDTSGTSANQYMQHISTRDTNGSIYCNFSRGDNVNVGSITQVNTTGVAYNTVSDYRLKDELGPVTDPLDRLDALRPIRFAWKADGTEVDGFLAHEAQEVVPEAVTGVKDEEDAEGNPVYQGIDQSKLVPLLVASVQALTAQVAALQTQVDDLSVTP